MLGLLLLYWIGKYFYKLAEKFEKSKWVYAILGIIAYYAGTIVFGFFFGIFVELISPGYVETMDDVVLGLIALPLGLLSCYLFYKYLEKTWTKNHKDPRELLDEIGSQEV